MEIILIILGSGAFGFYTKALIASTIIIGVYKLKKKEKIEKFNYINFIVLGLFTISYEVIMWKYGKFSFSFLITPCIAYFMGANICSKKDYKSKMPKYIISVALGLIVHAILNFLISLLNGMINTTRNTLDILTI